ncbi:hypothetical protein [Streptomyces gilvus]|nr:hypothetical protein [Streptomyces sp. CME 23]MCH5671056.1 hypothetical protein [Streptomyces sp. CME 23]
MRAATARRSGRVAASAAAIAVSARYSSHPAARAAAVCAVVIAAEL